MRQSGRGHRRVRGTVLLVFAALVMVICIRVVLAAGRLADTACVNPNPSLPGWAILLICVAMFGVGRLAVGARREPEDPAEPHREQATDVRTGLALHVALALVFLIGVGALAYETVGVWANPWGLAPITHYVRCARSASPLTTTLFAGTISFFVGHWLWFPGRRS